MQLNHLSLTNFRTFARLDVDFPGGSVLLVGGNAQGKTSLLEAIYFLATFISFHASNDRQLINMLAAREKLAVARIVADFQHTGLPAAGINSESSRVFRLEVRIIQENGANGQPRVRKEAVLNGVKSKLGDAVGTFTAVLFLPHMLRVIEGSPEERRRYLNLAMGQGLPHYVSTLSEYARVLTQRNALLKQIRERGGDSNQLSYWDEQLAHLGAQVIFARIQTVRELEHLAGRQHNELTRGREVLRLDYQPSFDPSPQLLQQYSLPLDTPADRSGISLREIETGFFERLQKLHSEEIERGVTTIGPHRDELRFLSNGIDLGTYGSRGQGRTAVLALKMAEVAWMKEKTGQWPLLLLDEVMAELDPERREDLLSRISVNEQAIMTTTDLDLFSEEFVGQLKIWQIADGRVVY